jgi:hypothetical protein
MDQLITQVENSSSFDQLKSCRIITYNSSKIDSNGNIQNFGDRYEAELTLSGLYLQIVSSQNEVTNEFIFLDGGGIQYYPNSNDISMDYQTAIGKTGGGMPTKDRTLTILKNNIQVLQSSDEIIDGVVCLHYEGVNNPTAELWVGRDDHRFRQITWQTPEQVNTEYISITKYYDFNASITIQAPLDESGNLLAGWQTTGKPPLVLTVSPSVTITLTPKTFDDPTTGTKTVYLIFGLTREWILANDKCSSPYFALVTFPTDWLNGSPFNYWNGYTPKPGDPIVFWVWAIDPSKTLEHIEAVPSDINSFIEDSIVYSDSGDIEGVKMLRMMLTIGEEETTMFLNFVDPGVPAPDMLNIDGSIIEGLKLPNS